MLPGLALFLGGAILSWTWNRAALVAFAAAVPWLNGMERTTLLPFHHPSVLCFCGVYLGWSLHKVWEGRAVRRPSAGQAEGTQVDSCSNRRARGGRDVINIIVTIVLASLVWQIARYSDQPALWSAFWRRPVIDFGDKLYFLTAAFLWLQALVFGGLIISAFCTDPADTADTAFSRQSRHPAFMTSSLKVVFSSYCVCLLVFAGIQQQWRIPEKFWNTFHTSPYEDIHSFGSIVVTCLVFLLARWRPRPIAWAVAGLMCSATLAALAIVSWSRATWLAGFTATALIVFLRIAWKWRITAAVAIVALLVAANLAARTPAWQNKDNVYLSRLGSLVRFENPFAKDFTRVNLYHKALRMIHEQPLTGHGIGSFYLNSINYAAAADPHANMPNFAHNTFLQFAAELGVPAALLLVALIVFVLAHGYRQSRRELHTQSDLTSFGLTVALIAFLITQMTANGLNIYPSNQFFFWFIVAAILTSSPTSIAIQSGQSERSYATKTLR